MNHIVICMRVVIILNEIEKSTRDFLEFNDLKLF